MKHHFKVLLSCTIMVCFFVCCNINATAQANVTIIDNTKPENFRSTPNVKPLNYAVQKRMKEGKVYNEEKFNLQKRSDGNETVSEKIQKVKARINEYVSKNCCLAEIEKLEKYLCDLESQEK